MEKNHRIWKNRKKSVLFIMTDDTRSCDVAEYLEDKYPEFKDPF